MIFLIGNGHRICIKAQSRERCDDEGCINCRGLICSFQVFQGTLVSSHRFLFSVTQEPNASKDIYIGIYMTQKIHQMELFCIFLPFVPFLVTADVFGNLHSLWLCEPTFQPCTLIFPTPS